MSFRNRLTLFFLLIVVLPMIAVAVFVLEVSGESQTAKADARLAAGLDSAIAVYESELTDAQGPLRDVATDPAVNAAIDERNSARAEKLARDLQRKKDLGFLELRDDSGDELGSSGTKPPFAASEVVIQGETETAGSVVGSVASATSYAAKVRELTGREVFVEVGGQSATTAPLGELDLPAPDTAQTVEIDGTEQRAASAELTGGVGPVPVVTLFGPIEEGGIAGGRPVVAGVLAVFFLVALGFVALLLRALHSQTSTMLDAAKRIGEGDFSLEVPVEGDDEMAGLAREFNKMSDRLETQMDELRGQRVQLAASVRRIGDAFASGLDRAAVLEIVAETAVSAAGARSARIRLEGLERPIEVGAEPSEEGLKVLGRAEANAERGRDLSGADEGRAYGLAHPLTRPSAGGVTVGSLAVVREDGLEFSGEQRDVLRYLVAQATTSIENISLHERVTEQAITDELTGLANNRALRSWLDNEVERAGRFGHELSVVMLDLDNFKAVNDTHGHLQGDEVLRMIGRVLREESRGIDEPARYGGEEFAVGLPETGAAGAFEVAERIRARIESTDVDMVEGSGKMRVTASLGVATLPDCGTDAHSLFSAADEALYAAKRGGKNKVVAAGQGGVSAQGDARVRRK